MKNHYNITGKSIVTLAGLSSSLVFGFPVLAADFTIANGQTVTTGQHLNTVGDVGTIENGGEIVINSHSSVGVTLSNHDITLNNFGTINVSGTGLIRGIISGARNATILNSGLIDASGTSSSGIVVEISSSNSKITNTGRIKASGNFTSGILSGNNTNTTIINSGSIIVTGNDSTGISSRGTNATITNSGTISATGTNSKAISITGNDTTLILKAGSNISGDVDFGTTTGGKVRVDNTISVPLSGGGSAAKKTVISRANIIGTHTVEGGAASVSGDIGNGVLVENNDTIAVVTPDAFAGADQIITEVVISSNNLLANHFREARLGESSGVPLNIQVADSGLVYSDVAENTYVLPNPATAWIEGFGSYQERPQNKDAAFSRARSGGILGGIDLPTTEQGYTFGFYVGGFAGQLDLGEQKFRDISNKGALFGGYVSKDFGGVDVDLQLTTGVSFNDSDRKVGTDIAKADYNSYFLSPSVTVSKDVAHEWGVLVPSLTLSYNGQYREDYKESGSIADQDVDGQYSSTVSARVMLENRFADVHYGSGVLKPAFRAGIDGQSYIGNRSTDLNVLGTDVSFDPNGSDQFVDGVAGINLSYAIHDGPELYMDSEINVGLNQGTIADNFGGTIRTGLRWNF